MLEFWIEADAFMRNMNRVLVGTMLEVARGRRSVEEFVSLLDGRPRPEAGPTAPPDGLYLAGVGYGGERVLPATGLWMSLRPTRSPCGSSLPAAGVWAPTTSGGLAPRRGPDSAP